MSGILNALLTIGVLVGGVILFQHRCDWLQFCGPIGGIPAAAAETVEVAGEEVPVATEETVTNAATSQSGGCCKCEMQGDRVKCMRNNDGIWFNPPAGAGGSNDQSVELSLQECNTACNVSGTPNASEREATETKTVVCPAGQGSVNGKCQVVSGKGGTGGGSKSSPKPAPKQSNTPKTGNLGEKGTVYVAPKPKATGSASYLNKGGTYKPGTILKAKYAYSPDQMAQAYFAQSGLRPYRAFSGRLSL